MCLINFLRIKTLYDNDFESMNHKLQKSRQFLEIRINFTIWLVTTLIKFNYYAIMIY